MASRWVIRGVVTVAALAIVVADGLSTHKAVYLASMGAGMILVLSGTVWVWRVTRPRQD
jgi:bifunctional ADP-heptose synthase (sugar kinase/adenylyltransferase)